MMQFIPTHPSQNRHLDEGVYAAEICDIEERTYDLDSHLIHVLLWLPEEGVHLSTAYNLYPLFPDCHLVARLDS